MGKYVDEDERNTDRSQIWKMERIKMRRERECMDEKEEVVLNMRRQRMTMATWFHFTIGATDIFCYGCIMNIFIIKYLLGIYHILTMTIIG